MKKQWYPLMLAAVLIAGMTFFEPDEALGAGSGFDIDKSEFGSWLLGYDGPGGDVVIPDGVTWISGGFENRTDITSVTIPGSVETIGSGAFMGCIGLTSVTMGEGVREIDMEAFEGCSSLTNVSIPVSVEEIGPLAFEGTPWLTSLGEFARVNNILIKYQGSGGAVVIPDGVVSIAQNAFFRMDEDNHITSMILPESLRTIHDGAFYRCSEMTGIEIPYGVTDIGNNAFDVCTGLTSITFPDSLKSLGASALEECPSLTDVKIPASVTSIGNALFYRSPNAVIHGAAGSTAEAYASENGIPFVAE